MSAPSHRSAPPLLWIIALTSLVLNLILCGVIAGAVGAVRRFAGQSADQLEALGNSTIATTVRLNEAVRIDTRVPFTFSNQIPVRQNVSIKTVVPFSQDVPLLGPVKFDIPIEFTVPVSMTVPIEINQDIRINSDVPVQIEAPVTIQIRDTPLKQQIDQLVSTLRGLAGQTP